MMDEPQKPLIPEVVPETSPGPVERPLRRKSGPPPKFDEQKRLEVCAIVGLGCTIRSAADYIGMSEDTIFRTARIQPQFAAELQRAKARGEIKLLRLVEKSAIEGQWRAATWLLAHCHQGRYQDHHDEGLKPEQLQLVLTRFVDVLMGEIRDTEDRGRVRRRLQELNDSLTDTAATARQLEHDP